jgi:hypothetical protein
VRSSRTTPGLAGIVLAVGLLAGWPRLVTGQATEGSAVSALGGGALGAYSGMVLGLVGATGPCNRLLWGASCPRAAAALGGALGLGAGAVLGGNDSGAVGGHLENAGYGAVAGGLVGWGLSGVVRQYAWPDPLAFAAVGAAIGASPEGAGLGFGVGATVGVLGWLTIQRFNVGDAISVAVVGLAVGGIAGWISDAAESRHRRYTAPAATLALHLRIPAP